MTVFDEPAKLTIHTLTSGIPRTINLLASRALMSAFIEESRTVGERHVRQAATHVFYSPSGRDPWAVFNPIRRFLGGTVENKPVIVDKNLLTPRPTRPPSRLRSALVVVIGAGVIVISGIYLFEHKSRSAAIQPVQQMTAKPVSQVTPPALVKVAKPAPPQPVATADPRLGDSAVISAIDTTKKTSAPPAGLLRNLPEFIPKTAQDSVYGVKNPGWELYRGKVTEFRVLREKNGIIKGIQVLDRGGAGVDDVFMRRALLEVAGTATFKVESTEKKESYKIERGKAGSTLQVVCYRDGSGGRLRAFALSWL
jgi:hypothetical protein